MYSRAAWGGPVDPFILVKFDKVIIEGNTDDPLVSLVIFEWNDEELIGKYPDVPGPNVREPIGCEALV
jgi:hypothetical protein